MEIGFKKERKKERKNYARKIRKINFEKERKKERKKYGN